MSEGVCAGENGSTGASSDTNAFRPSRRTVLAVAAWTVPVVIIGTAAPALAAASDPIAIGNWGPLCKHTGSDGDTTFPSGVYHIQAQWFSTYSGTRYVTIKSVSVGTKVYTDGITVIVDNPSGPDTTYNPPRFPLPADEQTNIVVHCVRTVAESSPTIVVTYEVREAPFGPVIGTFSSGPLGDVKLPTCDKSITN